MQITSIRLPAETVQQIEWLKIFMQDVVPVKYTTTDIIKIAIERMYKEVSNKKDRN